MHVAIQAVFLLYALDARRRQCVAYSSQLRSASCHFSAAQSKRRAPTLKYPTDQVIVTKWDETWHHHFHDELRFEPQSPQRVHGAILVQRRSTRMHKQNSRRSWRMGYSDCTWSAGVCNASMCGNEAPCDCACSCCQFGVQSSKKD